MSGDWVGQTFNDRYEIHELLGTGGMSSVYKATDPNLDRIVAIKIIHKHLSANADFMQRFRDEATAVAQLRHPNIVQVFDFDTFDDTAYIVFEYVPGENLQERIGRLVASDRTMSVDEVVHISTQITEALDYAHARGLVHRDVKPANIILDVHGNTFLADFGIVKIADSIQHTVTGAVIGTARYMSPEQIRGTQIDGRSDLYSLGVTMYEMANGQPPFEADSAMTLMMMHVNDPVPDMDATGIPAPLGGIIQRALAKDPEDRFPTAGAMTLALQGDDVSAPSPPPSVVPATVPIESDAPEPAEISEPMSTTSDQAPGSVSPTPPGVPTEPASGEPKKRTSRLLAIAGAIAVLAVVFIAGFAWSSTNKDTPTAVDDAITDGEATEASDVAQLLATTTSTETTTTVSGPRFAADTVATTTTTAPRPPQTVEITGITTEGGRYLVEYVTMGYIEDLPGDHVHFYWNTVDESQAGVGPNEKEWFVWGGPRPFDGYGLADRPVTANSMCSVVANPDHTIRSGTGNCFDLP